jgi:hypothetical protein
VLSFKKARSDVNFGDLEADMLNLGIWYLIGNCISLAFKRDLNEFSGSIRATVTEIFASCIMPKKRPFFYSCCKETTKQTFGIVIYFCKLYKLTLFRWNQKGSGCAVCWPVRMNYHIWLLV